MMGIFRLGIFRLGIGAAVVVAMSHFAHAQSPQSNGTSFADQMRQQAQIVQQQQQQFGGALPFDAWNSLRYRSGYRGYSGYGYPGYGFGYGYGYGYPGYGYPIYSYPTYGYPSYYRFPRILPGSGTPSQSSTPGSHYFGNPHASQYLGN